MNQATVFSLKRGFGTCREKMLHQLKVSYSFPELWIRKTTYTQHGSKIVKFSQTYNLALVLVRNFFQFFLDGIREEEILEPRPKRWFQK